MTSSPRIYLDYNATSPVRPEVRAQVEPIFFGPEASGCFGNASSVHWAGQKARQLLEEARARVARLLRRKASEIIFTSGGSEADNLALDGFLGSSALRGRSPRLVVSAVEHPAVFAAADRWRLRGADVRLAPVTPEGALDLDRLESLFEDPAGPPDLVSVMAVNNETGIVHDLGAVRTLCSRVGARLHVDAVQAAGRCPLSTLDADLLVLSGHKLGGLPGAGVLAAKNDLPLASSLVGGPQERGRRAGTESVAAAVSLATALELAEKEREAEGARLGALRDRLDEALSGLPGARVLDRAPRVPPVTTAVFEGVDGEVLLQALDLEGVAVSSGSACSSGSLEPSHVLRAMALPSALALSAVRFSLGRGTTSDEIDRIVELLPNLLARARAA